MQLALLSVLLSLPVSQTDPSRIGVKVTDFALRDAQGKTHRLRDWQDRRLLVVVFLGVECPLAKLYGPRLAQLAATYAERGVTVLGIHANQHESAEDLARYAREHQLSFPLLQDVGNVVADRFGTTRTPEAFILDLERVIRYHGRIDDQYDVGLQRSAPARRDLVEALDELLAGKAVSRPVTPVVGCRIGRAAAPGKGAITYAEHIAPILQKRCQDCHRPGQIGPFSLTSYADAAGWAAMIREVVEEGRMPPWHANPQHGRFANDRSLTRAEKQLLLDWIDADCPEGEPKNVAPVTRDAPEWNIPQPDIVLSIPRPFTVPAEGVIDYQTFVVDPGFKEDRWIQAAEIRPGNRAVVHHCNVFLAPPGSEEPAEQGALGSLCLIAMAAGTPPMVLPAGMAKRIPAGWRLVFVLHYSAIGSPQTDQTSIGLKFAGPTTVRQEVATKLMLELDLQIPPHTANHQVSQTWRINEDVLLLSMFPHMHLRGKSFRYEAIHPNGDVEVLLDVPRYDFNWQHSYILTEPRRLPAGTQIRCTALYDNSAGNPANPDPSATVRTGKQSWDEMFNGYFDVVLADQDLTRPIPWHATAWGALQSICSPGVALLTIVTNGLYLTRRRIAALVRRDAPGT